VRDQKSSGIYIYIGRRRLINAPKSRVNFVWSVLTTNLLFGLIFKIDFKYSNHPISNDDDIGMIDDTGER
jgi:hypothetical protein